MQIQKILAILAVVVSVTSCTATNTIANTSTDLLTHTHWLLTNLHGASLVPDSLISIYFENDKITGKEGCNNYNTSYSVNAGKLSVNKQVITTMMACPEPIMQQASTYINALTEAANYKIDGSQLTLMNTSGKILATFMKQSGELSGTSWTVTNINNGKQAVTSLIKDSKLTSVFSTDGKVSGSAGCNNYLATYETTGETIKIGSIASTRKMCAEPTGLMEQENQFLTALASAASYQFDGERLNFRTSNGALALVLVKP